MIVRGALRPLRSSVTVCRLGSTDTVKTTSKLRGIIGPLVCTRGAKRKTTIRIDDLPQGAIPPLPQDETPSPPEKIYPTVLQQHLNNVRKFSDCIVLTRVGDFYEMYFDQVDQYAPLVNLKKAKRATALGDVAMAGFQHTQLERYLKMFVQDLGKQVAISEQIRLPEHERLNRAGAPLYDRKVTRVITTGTLIDESFMDPFENNFLLAVNLEKNLPPDLDLSSDLKNWKRNTKIGLSWVDLSSGDFYTQAGDFASLPSMIARIGPREIVLDRSLESVERTIIPKILGDGTFSLHFHQFAESPMSISEWQYMLERPMSPESQSDFSADEVSAGGLILEYIRHRLFDTKVQLQPPVRRSDDEYMTIDRQSLRGLEIKSTLREGLQQGCLLNTIRRTVTKSGARLLSQRLVSPSLSLASINQRLDLAEILLKDDALREDIIALLRDTFDTFRLVQKFSVGRGEADDMLGLARTITLTQTISNTLNEHITTLQVSDRATQTFTAWESLKHLIARLDLGTPVKVAQNILDAIDEENLSRKQRIEIERGTETEKMASEVISADQSGEASPKLSRRTLKQPVNTNIVGAPEDIWIMRRHASSALQRVHKDLDTLLESKQELSQSFRSQLKADSLTLKWSSQLGHFCHVKGKDTRSLAALNTVRTISSTKSTSSFYFPEWSQLGSRIDDAKLRIRAEEERVFNRLRAQVLENLMKLRRNAAVLDELDVACSSATIAKERGLVRPILNEGTSHRIIGGRHPTVDVGLSSQGKHFTSNDCMVGDRERIYLITGPNMAGKSTYLRQNALITILAQTGCFVPAEYAEVGLVDKIFSRVGSADNLYQDQSTFMVEMLETAEILKQATPRSFVIMDEVGRGTTPQDGIAVAYACLHHLHHVNQCRSLFATHFHSLTDMTRDFAKLARYCTDVAEDDDGSWIYVHKLKHGVNRDSHALKVARLAGMPEEAITVAASVMNAARGDSLKEGQDLSSTPIAQVASAGA